MGINYYTTAAPSAITNNNYSVGRVTTIVQAGSQYADLDPSNLVLLAGILFSLCSLSLLYGKYLLN